MLAQLHQQWRLKRANDNFIRSYNNLLSLESEDGNSINVRKSANSDLSRFWSGYMAKALRAKETVERLIVKADKLVETAGRSRSSLSNAKNEVKPWRANELSFYDLQLDELKAAKPKLQENRIVKHYYQHQHLKSESWQEA